jgi:hypothetical protein
MSKNLDIGTTIPVAGRRLPALVSGARVAMAVFHCQGFA